MSKKNRRMMYDKLVADNALHKDDGALVKEFGNPKDLDVSYSDMTRHQLMKQCKKEQLDVPDKATKDDLVVILENKSDGIKPEEELKEELLEEVD